MKKLVIIRHAKAVQSDGSFPDRKRALNSRGLKNAQLMASRITERNLKPDVMFSSPAERASATAQKLAKSLGLTKKQIILDPDLYTFNADNLLLWLKELDNKYNDIVIVGHNPALTDLINFLALTTLDNLPTCGIAELELSITNWHKTESGCAELLFLDYPKKAAIAK